MFISYAQNLEDALLWRAFGLVQNGFFIDVGAGDPVAESVTKAFSLAGWSGINIEPSPTAFALLCSDRPDDVNLQVAAGAERGTFTYHAVDGGNGLSTGNAAYAELYASMSWPVTTVQVPQRTLADICDEYAPTTIHFLKIDVEGSERDVLQGADFAQHRPWVVMVEAVQPMALVTADGRRRDVELTPTTTHLEWEHLLLAANYQFVLFDGLNRLYVADEHMEQLGPTFSAPVNILDDVVRVDVVRQREQFTDELTTLERAVAEARGHAERATTALHHVERDRDAHAAAVTTLRTEVDRCFQELYEGSRALGAFAAQLQATQQRSAELEAQLTQQGLELHAALGQAEHGRAVERELHAVLASKAWRLTKPLRALRGLMVRQGQRPR